MHAPSPPELLAAWEAGSGHTPEYQAIVLLMTACPDRTRDELELLTVGRRDACLLELRSMIFGPGLKGIVTCPGCSERLELNFTMDDIRTAPARAGSGEVTINPGSNAFSGKNPDILLYTKEGYEIAFHLPTGREIAGIEGEVDPGAARLRLLASCIVSARRDDREVRTEEIPDAILLEISKQMGEADPQGDVRLDLVCPVCKYQSEHLFDIVPFLWTEIDVWARRTLSEVHVLASRYGWSESSILAMTPWKRQQYIGMEGE